MKKTYAELKAEAREKAIDRQLAFLKQRYSWDDLYVWGDYFSRLGKRYGLIKEFEKNGVI